LEARFEDKGGKMMAGRAGMALVGLAMLAMVTGWVGTAAAEETFAFEAEVHKLMDIIINSLYSNVEIFLRELISNASDALDKIRYQSLQDSSLAGDIPFEIRIRADEEGQVLSIQDTGIGMTREELVQNLGTIARSGTSNFLNNLQSSETADLGLIGQFGVGFYSAFLVADRVVVHTKSPHSDTQWVWDANSQKEYRVYEDPAGNTLGRGTLIELHIKDDQTEFLDADLLRTLVGKYSEFIDFPIFLWDSFEEEVPVEGEEEDSTDEEDDDDLNVNEDAEDFEDAEEQEPETMTVTRWEWDQVNNIKPIWTRKSNTVEEEEYTNFYQSLSRTTDEPLAHTHFSAEGDVSFKALLYVPARAPQNLFEAENTRRDVKLYVKRVFITDDFAEVVPRYLNFLKGVVDSDDLRLNVSRETLQHNKVLKSIRKKLVRKVIAMLQDLANEDEEKYAAFWEEFGTNVKLGALEDEKNRDRLAKLLRFHSSATGELTSFADYVERMKEGQEKVYFFAQQDTVEAMRKSPLVEKLLKRDYEVLFMVDPIDEYLFQMGGISEFDGHSLVNVAKDNLQLEDEEDEEADAEALEEEFSEVVDFLKETLGRKVMKVSVSKRLTSSPSALVASEWGWTANMAKLAKSQPLADNKMQMAMMSMKTLEINPHHPIVQELKARVEADDKVPAAATAQLLFDTAALSSGFEIEDPHEFAGRIHAILEQSLGLEPQAAADDINLDDLSFEEEL